jgi:hypothetical protein
MSQIGSPTGGPTQSADAQQNMAVNDAVVVVALVKSAFSPAELGWWVTHYYNSNTLPFTLNIYWCMVNTMIELFSIWFLVKGNDHCHFHICSVIGLIFCGYFSR